jgi:hypothetical protein
MFVNYPLPAANSLWLTQASVDSYNFHLQSGSPAAGKGTTNSALIKPIALPSNLKIDANFGPSELTLPGADMGCYQLSGTGNHH